MNRRDSLITIRANTDERTQFAAVARRLGQTEAGAFRLLLREKARELGIMPSNDQRRSAEQAAGIVV